MQTNLHFNCDLNSNLHLFFAVRFGVVGHFLYIVRWEEQLHLSTVVTFPPVVSRIWGAMNGTAKSWQVYADEHARCSSIEGSNL